MGHPPGAHAPGAPPAAVRPPPRPRDDEDDDDDAKTKAKAHPHNLHDLILAHPFFWGIPTVVLVATTCGFLGAFMALQTIPVSPTRPVVKERASVASECRNIEVQFGVSSDMIERNMLERMHDRLGCDAARLAATLGPRR